MDPLLLLLILAVLVVILFDYTNGFHDASNVVATMISSGAMTPRCAVLLASLFEFLGPLLGGTAVANTLGKLVDMEYVQKEMGQEVFVVHAQTEAGQRSWRVRHIHTREEKVFRTEADLLAYLRAESVPGQAQRFGQRAFLLVILAAVLGAIFWNLLTWYLGLPSSSSHALVGGLVGATLAATRQWEAIRWGFHDFNLLHPHGVLGVLVALFVSPLLGFLLGAAVQKITRFLLRRASPRANDWLKRLQWLTSSALAFSHGTNDAQKSMGVITLLLFASGSLPRFEVPLWVQGVCASAITLGILSGGWRIMRTIGRGIFRLRPIHGFSSQLASAAVVLGHALIGGPVSTTHVVSSTVMGVGTAERKKAVRWNKVGDILAAWGLTLPAAALAGAGCYALLSPLTRYL
jgi:PiT family inorganic phosphate transporter